ncbi:MAG: hypothetical protein LBB88_03930 [Planctomycetaceae bacterium]|jgi:hypothetical protein|nr:hypothetical protein [Planctomycetaceae bacterium]
MKKIFLILKVVFVVVLFAFIFFANEITFAQNQYRRPSQNDIEWLLGNNNKSKLPNRNTINFYEYSEDNDKPISQAVFNSRSNSNDLFPEPCQPITCSQSGVKLKNPTCQCEYCDSRNSRYVEPCGKVKTNSQKIKQTKSQKKPQIITADNSSTEIENNNDSNSISESASNVNINSDDFTPDSKSDSDLVSVSDNNENNIASAPTPIVAVDPVLSISSKVVNLTQQNKTPKQTTIQFATQKTTPIETESEQNISSNAVKIAYPENPIHTPAPLNKNANDPQKIAALITSRDKQPKTRQTPQVPPAAQIKPKQRKYQTEIGEYHGCGITKNNAVQNNAVNNCPQNDISEINCSCDSYEQQFVGCGSGSGEIIAETCVGVLFRHVAKLRYARIKHNANHNEQCNCWLCANLDNPDMTGIGIFNSRVAGFEISATNNISLHDSPNMFLSRADIATHFNAETRNRAWVDYRQFNNSVATAISLPNGNYVAQDRAANLFTFGLERCIGIQSSLEVRIPLIYQFGSDSEFSNRFQNLYRAGGGELGNITLSAKYVFARTKKITLTTGLGVSLPTAEDWKITNYNASIENKTYEIVPYLAFQWHPNDSVFGHLLVQTNIPISKNEIHFADQKSKIEESQLIQVGAQLGRWFYRNEYGMYSCRIGGFIEIDYAAAIDSADNGIIADMNNNFIWLNSTENKPDRLNLTAALPVSFGQFSINNAVIVPISNNRPFSIAYNFSLCRKF